MTLRTTAKETGRRVQTSQARCTLRDFDDDHDMMEIKAADVMTSETPTNFERWQQAGMTCHPMPQEQDQQQQGQQDQQQNGQQDGGGNGEQMPWNMKQPKGPSAEGLMMYPGGSRSHPVCAAIDDRRVRPYQTKPGEALYYSLDGSGQTMYHRVRGDGMDGLYLLTCDDEQQSGHGAHGHRALGRKPQARFVSMRHVNKKKQQRKSKKLQQAAQQQFGLEVFGLMLSADGVTVVPLDGGQGGGQQQDYKHEGDSVNTETRHYKGSINHYDGDTEVANYKRQGKEWCHHTGDRQKSTRSDDGHSHIKNSGGHVWVAGACFKSTPFIIKPDPCK
jgi:phage gp45-like